MTFKVSSLLVYHFIYNLFTTFKWLQAAIKESDSPVITAETTTAGQRTVVNCALLSRALGLPHTWPGKLNSTVNNILFI
jgi:hypothetical protein